VFLLAIAGPLTCYTNALPAYRHPVPWFRGESRARPALAQSHRDVCAREEPAPVRTDPGFRAGRRSPCHGT